MLTGKQKTDRKAKENTKQKTDRKARQDNKSSREELGAWKVEINWNNCLLQRWICCADITDILNKTISKEIP